MDAWYAGAAPELACGLIPPASLVGMGDDNVGSSWRNMTWHKTRAASVVPTLFFPTLFVGLGAVRALGLALYGGEKIVSLNKLY